MEPESWQAISHHTHTNQQAWLGLGDHPLAFRIEFVIHGKSKLSKDKFDGLSKSIKLLEVQLRSL